MKMGGAICSECRAGFRRVELESERGTEGEYRCPLCGNLVEKFDGNRLIAYRLTIIPPKYLRQFPHAGFLLGIAGRSR
jgi:DNA-directed RNA polymerase subunit RPC12/RpoP